MKYFFHFLVLILGITSPLLGQEQSSRLSDAKGNLKGKLFLSPSYILWNYYNVYPDFEPNTFTSEQRITTSGYIGLQFDFDFYYHQNRFLSFGIGVAATHDSPSFIGEGNPEKPHRVNTVFSHLTHQHHVKRFTLGYGLSYGRYFWLEKTAFAKKPNNEERRRESNHDVIGFHFPLLYHLQKRLHIGLLYNPSFYRTNVSPISVYEHRLSIVLRWNHRLFG